MGAKIEASGLQSVRAWRPASVNLVEVIAYLIIFANVVNLNFARLGIVPDVLLLGASIPAFLWTLNEGIDTRRIRLYLYVVAAMVGIYVLYSALHFSYDGFRNAAALFAVTATFLFFYRASGSLCTSTGFLMALFIPLVSFVILWESPYAVAKNNINGAMCYYLVAIFFCYPGLKKIKTRHVTLMFSLIFVISAINGHRTLAGSSVLLLLQYYVLSMNIARAQLRILMFVGLIAVVAGIIALLVDPDMAVFSGQIK